MTHTVYVSSTKQGFSMPYLGIETEPNFNNANSELIARHLGFDVEDSSFYYDGCIWIFYDKVAAFLNKEEIFEYEESIVKKIYEIKLYLRLAIISGAEKVVF